MRENAAQMGLSRQVCSGGGGGGANGLVTGGGDGDQSSSTDQITKRHFTIFIVHVLTFKNYWHSAKLPTVDRSAHPLAVKWR